MYIQKQLNEYIDSLASCNSVPGGGSAAAAVAGIGVALGSMVARFTQDQKSKIGIKSLLKKNEILRKRMVLLVDRDTVAYLKLEDILKVPKNLKQRDVLVQKNLKQAALVPFEVCVLINSAMDLCQRIAKLGNKNLITDSGCAMFFLDSAFFAAMLNVKINLKYIKDKKFVKNKKDQLKKIADNISRIKKSIEKQIKDFI